MWVMCMTTLQTHNLLISSTSATAQVHLPPSLLYKQDVTNRSCWKVWVSKLVMPRFIPNIDSSNRSFSWNGVIYLWPGMSSARDICYQLSSAGCLTKWSHVNNRFVFQCSGVLDLSAPNSCAGLLGMARKAHSLSGGMSSGVDPQLGLLDYVVVSSSLASKTHVWRDGKLWTDTQVLCTLPVNESASGPYEDASGARSVCYDSSLINGITIKITDSQFTPIHDCVDPWHCTVTLAEIKYGATT